MLEFLNKPIELGTANLTLERILLFLVALLASWLLIKLITRLVYNNMKKREVDHGKIFAITRIVKYILYVIFIAISLQILHLNLKGLLIGASALLIGVGIGLQQIFYDLFSGILMLFERKVQVGDYIDMDGMIGRVDKISMRTSVVRSIDNVSVIVPNSKLISDNVINWSSNRGLARFNVTVGVAYGSDVEKVRKVLSHCATNTEKVLNKPAPLVLFTSFGDSTLNFKLNFWTRHFREIDIIKSDLNFAIDKAFAEENITIAFPQIDVHMKRDF